LPEVVVGVAGGVDRRQFDRAHPERRAVDDADVGARQRVECRTGDAAAGDVLQLLRRGDVVGVDVRLDREREREAEAVQLGEVAFPGRQHRIDQQRLARFLAAEEVGVGAGDRLEQLFEDHGTS